MHGASEGCKGRSTELYSNLDEAAMQSSRSQNYQYRGLKNS